MSKAVGIDFGTTRSSVGFWQNDDVVEIIEIEPGKRTIGSYVSFTSPTKAVVGANLNKTTAHFAKALLGRTFESDEEVKQIFHREFPSKVIRRNQEAYYQLDFGGQQKEFSPTEISTMVLKRLKQAAEVRIGEEVTNAVINIPAQAKESQIRATIEAASEAGFIDIRVIAEPSAVALAFGLEKKDELEGQVFAVVDIGAASTDVSVSTLEHEDMTVHGKDTHPVGGIDFDLNVMSHIIKEYKEKFKQDLDDPAKDALRYACVKAIRDLDDRTETTIQAKGQTFRLTRDQFNRINEEHFGQVVDALERAMRNAGKSRLDSIVLVGGSSRIPQIANLIHETFGKRPDTTLNPDEAVVRGAALRAAKLFREDISDENAPTLREIVSRTLGMRIMGGKVVPIITSKMIVPAEVSKPFSTSRDNQTVVSFKIYEVFDFPGSSNKLLGTFSMTRISPAPRGVPEIKVTFKLNDNGLLEVSAIDTANKRRNEIKIIVNRKA